MKQLIVLILLIITSCSENKNQIISKNYAPLDKKIPPCICEYWYSDGLNSVPFQDSCNKYNVFDTLKFNQNK
jgi:hypothetical protein